MTDADLAAIRRQADARTHRVAVVESSQGRVVVKGQQATRSRWRTRLGNGLAVAAGLPFLRNADSSSPADTQALEVARLRALHAAGVAVPEVLHVEPEYFVMSHLPGRSLIDTMDSAPSAATEWWQRGMKTLLDVHRRGQYLSQAFARNFVVVGESLAMIDFEDDPGRELSLEQAQARDWLAYLHSTAWRLPAGPHERATLLRRWLAEELPQVRALVEAAGRKLAWMRHLPSTRRPFGREVVGLQALAALFHDEPGHEPLHT